MTNQDDLFHPVIELPEPTRRARYDRLVGLDDTKLRLRKEAALLADPRRLQVWAANHYGGDIAALTLFADRAPLFVFAGDVGSGKSALAESFGCDLADFLDLPVYLYRLKLATRGSGLVGEMTSLIGDAFAHMHTVGKRMSGSQGARAVQILVVDEADALVQSRGAQQMHHEDRRRRIPGRHRQPGRCPAPCRRRTVHQPARRPRPSRHAPRCGHLHPHPPRRRAAPRGPHPGTRRARHPAGNRP
ncbi:AAA family ATPase [Saccharopolyspora spinosa]|uniref:AAA family ATPase n=1 Tax=Saccharopolyspora spinosa TaxID=60894 RepID=UPI00374915C3